MDRTPSIENRCDRTGLPAAGGVPPVNDSTPPSGVDTPLPSPETDETFQPHTPSRLTKSRVQRLRIRDRVEWMRWRQQDVTASAVGALFGVHEYQTAYGLWQEKAGYFVEPTADTPFLRRGRLLEPVAIQMLREDHPTWSVRASKLYYRDPLHRLGATPDCRARDPLRPGWGNVQIKSVDAAVFHRKWRNADGQPEPPLWIVLQSLIEAHLSGAAWAAVAAIVPAFSGFELHLIDIPLHRDLIDAVHQRVDAFWQSIEVNAPPAPDLPRDADLFLQLRPAPDGSRIDLSEDAELPALLAEDEALIADLKTKTDRRKAIRAEVAGKLGSASYARFQGGNATSRSVDRKAYSVEASSYRDVRLTRDAT